MEGNKQTEAEVSPALLSSILTTLQGLKEGKELAGGRGGVEGRGEGGAGRWEQGETGGTRGEQRRAEGSRGERGRSERAVVGDDELDDAEGCRNNQINAEPFR